MIHRGAGNGRKTAPNHKRSPTVAAILITDMNNEILSRNPPVLDSLAMRATAKEKLAASANTARLFHRLCLLHRLNRRHSGDWRASAALENARETTR